MITDDHHHRRVRASRVVQVGEAVPEAGAEVQEGGSGRVAHACVPVGRARGSSLEEGEHPMHLRHRVEARDKVHLRRAGVGEHDVDTGRDETADHRFAADHPVLAVNADGASNMAPGLRIPSGSNAALIRPISASFAGSSRARK